MDPDRLAAIAPPPSNGGMSAAEFGARAPGQGPKNLRGVGAKERARYSTEVTNMIRQQDFRGATVGHLVALYCWCHAEVYRVPPTELDGPAPYALACVEAKRFVDREFGGRPEAAVPFVKWTWRREGEREDWRVKNGRSGGRVGWRLQFSANLLTDWKIDVARTRGTR